MQKSKENWWGFLGGSAVKNLPVMQETWVQFLGQEDPLRKEMATHSRILAWEIPWKEGPGGLQSMELQRVGHDWVTNQQKKKKKVWCCGLKTHVQLIFLFKAEFLDVLILFTLV